MAKTAPPIVGDVIEIPYPFVRDKVSVPADDSDGPISMEIDTWRPGTRNQHCFAPHEDYVASFADGMGAQLLWIISIHKPGKFPTRVFFTRKWRDPDGKQFGKGGLRVLSIAAFRSVARGYRHPFEMARAPVEA